MTPLVYADFNNLDDSNRLRLTCAGTKADLASQRIEPREDLQLTFYMDDADDEGRSDKLLVDGVMQYNPVEECWIAIVNWDTIRHASDQQSGSGSVAGETVQIAGQQVATTKNDVASLLKQAASVAGAAAALGGMSRGGIATATEATTAVSAPAEIGTPVKLSAGARPRLVVMRGLKLNVEYPIYEGRNFIGRADEKPVDIDLDDQEPQERIWSSRQHALITFENGDLNVEDLNSANGTFVNRTRLYPGQKRPLTPNDVIQVGTVMMKFKT